MSSKGNNCGCTPNAPEIIRSPITEAELQAKDVITPDDVLRLNYITES